MKGFLIGIASLIGLMVLIFVLELFGLGMFKFFEPKRENIRREVFENTKSYTHGVIQDLGKYYAEYQKAATMEEKQTIQTVVRTRFSEFDATKIQSTELRNFFINCRGY